jgi:hypothetical protein
MIATDSDTRLHKIEQSRKFDAFCAHKVADKVQVFKKCRSSKSAQSLASLGPFLGVDVMVPICDGLSRLPGACPLNKE